MGSPPNAPQCAVVTNNLSLLGPKTSQIGDRVAIVPRDSPPKQHDVIFKAVGKTTSASIVPSRANLTIRDPPQLRKAVKSACGRI